ncbi:MAG: hypothetical protein GX275_10290, partial [Clostridiales bacterium]|nr:hypothetical protein [Clostridiales bacterium]
MGKLSKKLVSIITTAVVALGITFTSIPAMETKAVTSIDSNGTKFDDGIKSYIDNNNVESNSATDYGLPTKIIDGSILHAWCWSFNVIKENMKAIAESGYGTVQTSPAGICKAGDNGGLSLMSPENGGTGKWWYHYQPTDFKLGNYQLGTEEEFKAMAQEAKKYGIKVIVDVVLNHCTSDYGAISDNVKNIPGGAFHNNGGIPNYDSRWNYTQCNLLNLIDLNTQNVNVQNYVKKYLQDTIAAGASGFRYDAAKHIELPDDSGFGSDFWPNVTQNGSEFQYGEVLQGNNERIEEFGKWMGVTASNFGKDLRDKIGAKNLNAGNFTNLQVGLPANKLVTWVESHDNFCNGPNDWGASCWMNDWQIRMGWAIIGARANGAPLFFSRPQGSDANLQWSGKSKIGDIGNDNFKHPEVVAVNKFKNAMLGENENLRNPDGKNNCIMIERGNKGVVIANMGSQFDIRCKTSLKDGTYTDTVYGGTYTVSGGNFTGGSIPDGKIVVLYDHVVTSGAKVSSSVPSGKFKGESLSVTLSVSGANSGTYSVDGGSEKSFTNGTTITVGQNLQNGESTK